MTRLLVSTIQLTPPSQAAKSTLSGKASFAAVGDLFQLPFAEDLGLTV